MPVHRTPFEPYHSLTVSPRASTAVGAPAWNDGYAAPPGSREPEGVPWLRYIDVIKRHAVLIAALVSIGSGLGYLAARRVRPVYEAQATVWINAPSAQQTGPIRAQQLLPSGSWIELLRSYAIVDEVVRSLRLNVIPKFPADSVLFRGFESTKAMHPGVYVLHVDSSGKTYSLSTIKGVRVE